MSALEVYEQVYRARRIDTAALPGGVARLPVSSDMAQVTKLNNGLSAVAPKFVQLTNDVVFGDLWRRSDLTVRDRSLVTLVALAAMDEDDEFDVYVRRAIERT